MNEFLNTMRKQVTEWAEQSTRTQKIRIAAIALLILTLVIAAFVYFGRVEYAVLYSGMDAAEAGTVYDKLNEMNVPVQARGNGTILVPADMVSSLTMQLAAQGYPQSGFSYDQEEVLGFGATEEDKKQANVSRDQARLRETLKAHKKVKDAYVTIVPADENKYALSGAGNVPASASVWLELYPGQELTAEDALTIGRSIKTSVRGLEMDQISLSDTEGRSYDLNVNDSNHLASNQLEIQKGVRDDLKQTIDEFLSPLFGDAFTTALSVNMNFDRAVTEETTYSPPNEGRNEGIAISKDVTSETIVDGTVGGTVGATANTGANTYPAQGGEADSRYERSSEKFNYEVNSITERIEKANGNVEELSVSVIIDSNTYPDVEASDIQSALYTALKASTLNISTDNITVMLAPLIAKSPVADVIARQQDYERQQQTNDLIRIAIIAAAVVIVILILLLMLRTLMNAKKLEVQAAAEAAAAAAGLDGLIGADGMVRYEGETDAGFATENADNNDRARIEAFIEKDAESVARLLRNWLAD